MAITFDPIANRIILDTANVTASQIWSRWVDWVALSDNAKYRPMLRQVGGDDLGSGLSIPIYIFQMGTCRVRPMEANHTLIITGNLFNDDGGVPVVQTLGNFNVSVQYTVPVQAQGIATGGGGGGLTQSQSDMLTALASIHGLVIGSPLVVTQALRVAGAITQTVAEQNGTVTITRT